MCSSSLAGQAVVSLLKSRLMVGRVGGWLGAGGEGGQGGLCRHHGAWFMQMAYEDGATLDHELVKQKWRVRILKTPRCKKRKLAAPKANL